MFPYGNAVVPAAVEFHPVDPHRGCDFIDQEDRSVWKGIGHRRTGNREAFRRKTNVDSLRMRPGLAAHRLGQHVIRFSVVDSDPNMLL